MWFGRVPDINGFFIWKAIYYNSRFENMAPPLDFSGTLDIFTIPGIYHKDPLSQHFPGTI